MEKNKNILLSIGLIIIIALSFLLFFGIGESNKNGIQISSFAFVILDEIIIYAVILWASNKEKNTFLKAGVFSSVFIYLISSIVFNMFLKNMLGSLNTVLVINIAMLLIFSLILVIIMFFNKEN